MSIRLKYILALSLVAVFVSSSAIFMQYIFSQQNKDAEIINKAGQQRMLSQRIALLTTLGKSTENTHAYYKTLLANTVALFESNHRYLTELPNLPEAVKTLYYGPIDLDNRVKNYIAYALANSANKASGELNLYAEITTTDDLLADLNKAVIAFELDAKSRVAQVKRIEIALWIMTLMILLLEAVFIFRPLERDIKRKFFEIIQAREQAERAEQLAQEASKTKSEFLANMSHELRTPMNGMFGMMELALDNPDKMENYLKKAKLSGKQLLVLINDLLDFSKIEAGKLNLEKTSFELMQILDDLAAIQDVQCRSKGLVFEFQKTTQLPQCLLGDPTRLSQVLNNLLSNAIKFTHQGKVILQVGMHIKDKRPWLTFHVIDTGIGIAPEKLSSIFEKFTQADQSTTRHFGGTGLGLAITQSLIQIMGGEISVKSEINKGSQFTVTIPTEIYKRESIKVDSTSTVHCVIVDDLNTSGEYLKHLVNSLGMQSIYFNSPEAFLASDAIPDILLLDVAMPEMDGITTLAKLAQKHPNRMPFVIYVTAIAENLIVPIELRKFVWKIHSKPIQRDELEQDLQELKAVIAEKTKRPNASLSPQANILLVEDNEINAEIAKTMLESSGHNVTLASNGEKAVNACQHHRFDVILMDMNMPVMDGITATTILRQKLKIDTPIIALTANAYAEDKLRCEQAGMNGHLNKPIDKSELLQTIDTVIEQKIEDVT